MPHHPPAALQPLSTFVMEVLPWAASGAIGLYLLWTTCLAPDAVRALAPATPEGATISHLTVPERGTPSARRGADISMLPRLAQADQLDAM